MTKKIILAPLFFIESIADRATAAAGALVFMQIPSFIVQYLQRLGGHVDELTILVGKYKTAASDNGRTLENYIQLHIQSGVKEFASTGKLMSENIERLNYLSEAYTQISGTTGIKKFFIFIRNSDVEIIKGTCKDFVPGISLSLDSLIYAAAGIVLFMSVYLLIKKTVSLIFNRLVFKR